MPITYGQNLTRRWGPERQSGTVLMKAYTSHTEVSDVFVSYQHTDRRTALELAEFLDEMGTHVFIDVHDDSLVLGHEGLEDAMVTAIKNSRTMIIVVSDETQRSWWVPWEIGVATPFGRPKALHKPQTSYNLPDYIRKLKRLWTSSSAYLWLYNTGAI